MNNELYHYGVKGMHWGVRRYQPYPKGYSGSGKYVGKRGRIGKMSWKQINRATENAIAKSYAKDNTEEELRRKRNLSIALGVGGAGLGLGIYAASKKFGKQSAIKAQKAKNLSDLSSKFMNNARNFERGGKSALGAGLAVLGGGAVNAARINNAIKLKKQKSKIKGIDDYDDNVKRREKLRNRILVGAGAAAGLGLGIYTGRRAYKTKMRNAAQKLRGSELKKELSEAALEKLRLKKKPKEIDIKRAENAIKINSKQLERLRLKQPKIKRAAKRLGVATALSLGASGAGLGYGLTGSFDDKKRRRRR